MGSETAASNDVKSPRFSSSRVPTISLIVVLLCVLAGWIGHLGFFLDLAGSGAGSFVRRQSEAYAMIALVVVFWAGFAGDGHPASQSALEEGKPPSTRLAWYGWFVALLVFSVAMVAWDGAPGFFVTQKEALVGVAMVSWYLAWSRGLRPQDAMWRRGGPVRSRSQRYRYYLGVLVLIVLAYTNAPTELMGEGIGVWLAESNEGFVAAILIPLYFDLFSRSRGALATAGWYGFLVLAPVSLQLNVYPDVFSSQVSWFAEVTEAFIAALAISAVYDVLRVTSGSPQGDAPDHTSQRGITSTAAGQ